MSTKKQLKERAIEKQMQKPIDSTLDTLWEKMKKFERYAAQIKEKIIELAPVSVEAGMRFKYFIYRKQSFSTDFSKFQAVFDENDLVVPMDEVEDFSNAKEVYEEHNIPIPIIKVEDWQWAENILKRKGIDVPKRPAQKAHLRIIKGVLEAEKYAKKYEGTYKDD